MTMHKTLRRGMVVAALIVPAMANPSAASAGRLVATGHDTDHHCGREGEGHSQCHFFKVAVDYVRSGAPDPTKPVLVLDRGQLDVVTSLDRVYGRGVVPRTVIEPRSAAFKTTPITTSAYSAVIIASSGGTPSDATQQDLNEMRSTPDSDAIDARAADLRTFFDSGGGIFVNSGNRHGDGPNDPYYAFLPIGVRGNVVKAPFQVSPAGQALGITQADVSCCPTHNTFETPSSDSALRSIDTDSAGRIVSIFAEASQFTKLGDPPITPATQAQVGAGLPSTSTCLPRRKLRLRLRRPAGLHFSRATFYVNGKRVKRLRGRQITRRVTIRVPRSVKRGARIRLKIVVITTGKQRIVLRRTYRRCR